MNSRPPKNGNKKVAKKLQDKRCIRTSTGLQFRELTQQLHSQHEVENDLRRKEMEFAREIQHTNARWQKSNSRWQKFAAICAFVSVVNIAPPVAVSSFPGLLTGTAYMIGMMLGTLGVLKIRNHVENPTQTPLQDGAIRLTAGGAIFALPIIYEAMQHPIGSGGGADAINISKVGSDFKL